MKQLVAIASFIFLCSCGAGDSDVNLDPGYDYFPLELGASRTYQVEEIIFEAFESDTNRYWLQEVVGDTLISGDGTISYLVSRYKSADESNWTLDSVWSARRSELVAVVTENDVPFCKMTFPILTGKSWDGNVFNTRLRQEYYYETVSNGELIDTAVVATDLVKVVIEEIPQNLVNQDERYEVYGRGIGLVAKNYIQLSFCTLNCESKGSTIGEIEKGRILSQTLIAYGEE